MSGLGSFIQGAFQGYQFGEGVKDTKRRRAQQDKDSQWQDESRGRTRSVWDQQDQEFSQRQKAWEHQNAAAGRQEEEWQRADAERAFKQEAFKEAQDGFQNQMDPQGNPAARSVISDGQGPVDRQVTTAPDSEMQTVASGQQQRQDYPTPAPQPRSVAEATATMPGPNPQTEQPAAGMQPIAPAASTPPPDDGGAPSVEIAKETAPAPRSVTGGPISAAQRERGTQSFMTYYRENAAPKIEQYYLSQGDTQKADAWRKWMDAGQTKKHLKYWAGAVQAAAVGDDQGFIDGLLGAYDQIDDGYTILRDKSGLIKDDNGNITGAKVTFKDQNTGRVFSQDMSQGDIVQQGIYALSPEQMFETLYAQTTAATAARAKQQAGDQDFNRKVQLEVLKSQLSGNGMTQKDIVGKVMAEAKAIREANVIRAEPLTDDQIIAQSVANVSKTLQLTQQSFGPNGEVRTEPPPYR
ncbi:hypothetical protein DL1_08440 [Thioclava dalianensis]|uniref:Uncharacterized protein n=1 Tax=Thioclava dalianensis TaxID=1185766 RepID=A0A074TAL4_9RHOB|nr:hypothetical protein [Thioclava dalianensis]KEP68806.1 hypothetical protein DL1_08440 [Thioclava dalianensis]SFN50442.1 hypothetical protein SAMN05216224_106100 [Thioclava dalianensis]